MEHTYSKNALDFTESFEGCKYVAYKPFPTDPWTLGYGHTKGVKEGATCTEEQAEAWLAEDVQDAAKTVNYACHAIFLKQNEFDALVDFVFNLGGTNFLGSTMLRKLRLGDFAGAADEFHKWDMAGGKHVAGLLRRRLQEEELFEKGDYNV